MAAIAEALQIARQHHQAGRLHEAKALYRQILQFQPNHPEVLHLLGVLAGQAGQHDTAIEFIRKAIALNPSVAEFHNNLGNALQDRGSMDEAVACYQKAIALNPTYAEAHGNLGNLWLGAGLYEEAAASYRRALALKPSYVEAQFNLGKALQAQGQAGEAIACYRHALILRPGFADAYNNLGIALQEQGFLEEAISCYRRTLFLQPSDAGVHSNLAIALALQGNDKEAWENFRLALAISPDNARIHSVRLFAMNYSVTDPAAIAQEYRRWNELHTRPLACRIKRHLNKRDCGRRVRVGYLSADFRDHAISYFVAPLLASHDHVEVEVYCYSNVARPDMTTKHLQACADGWRDITALTDEAVMKRISSDGIDILVDLSGHTKGNRLLVFAQKPAPVQVTYLGSLTTTGLTAMDYRLTDRFLTPTDTTEWFSEELMQLPECFVCYRPPAGAPSVAPLPAVTNGYLTFGSFNNMAKLVPHVVKLWSDILGLLPGSRLVLKDKTLQDPVQRNRFREQFRKNGIEEDRIELLPWTMMRDNMATYGRIDIGLDPFPYNGCTTTCDALWMGVPVITLAGVMSYSRFGVSLLSNLGLEELIAATPEAYVEKAVALAKDLDRLATLRGGLRARMAASPLCDAKTFTRGVEDAYRIMWRRWCETSGGA